MSKSEAKTLKGIYLIELDGRNYVGKDTQIESNKRFKEHSLSLERGKHFNRVFQEAYNKSKTKDLRYKILETSYDWTHEEHVEKEIFYIEEEEAYTKGYNLTRGGFGLLGYKFTEEQLERKSRRVSGDRNPMSKITEEDFDKMYEMFMEYKTNEEIAEEFGLHSRYVSLIRHKRRLQTYWKKYPDYVPVKSDGAVKNISKINKEQFLEIVYLLEDGWTNAGVERKYDLSSGTISRLRNRVTFKTWWEILYDRKKRERSTTIESNKCNFRKKRKNKTGRIPVRSK